MTHRQTLIILDFGSQYSQLIARRVRELNVYCELLPHDTGLEQVEALNPIGFILSGGPASVYDAGAPKLPPYLIELRKPVLGVCYGMQLLVHHLGGRVVSSPKREYGLAALSITQRGNPLFAHLDVTETNVWMSHGDRVVSLPQGFQPIAASANSPYAGVTDQERDIYGVQFHPEVVHTEHGRQILRAFAYGICQSDGGWTTGNMIDEAITAIQAQVGTGQVVCGLSGGVDSSVTAALLQRAIGDQLTCIFVNTGMMRLNEPEQVVETFQNQMQARLVAVDAGEIFLSALDGVTDPEAKRKIIGEKFIRIFEAEAHKLGQIDFLAQGTLYPDVIESAGVGRSSAKIKSHHNVGGLPDDMAFALVEPLRMMFKDEARAVGEALGLPQEIVWRHPFPGPGLAVRILGEVTWERLETLRQADAIFMEELWAGGWYHQTSQAFTVLLPVRSVGVMGDGRTYGHVAALRAVTTDDFMTADWTHLPPALLATVSNRVVNEVPAITRVVYDISSKPPATIEWE